ncbi:MAG: hypothetical protein IKR09_08520 [Alphaproteobacteria bacterium]|nr:hypothetical protein [Alphaproteobacteria bacterium]
MVILPFYRFLIGTHENDRIKYAFLTHGNRLVPAGIPFRFPAYHQASRTIYGLWNQNGKEVIGRTSIQPPYSDITPLFSHSDRRISHIAVSPDNLKIAFLATDETTQQTQLRVIAREEFGWFPLPFIRLPAANSPICFCTSNIVMYTGITKQLNAVRLTKPAQTTEINPQGDCPVYSIETKFRAFKCGDKVLFYNKLYTEIDAKHQPLSFSKDGLTLFLADKKTLYAYNPADKEYAAIFQSEEPIVFVAEL